MPAEGPLPDTRTGVDLARRLAPGTLVGGRYRIVAQLGIGGMGVVYRARDEELGQDVALKVLRPDLGADPQWIARFRRELVLAREVTHRNVVRIHDIGESDGLRFLTMRYVDGRSLLEVLDAGPLPVERAVRIVRQLAEALANAHEAGIVHRDLKPGNVLLEADDTAYVTDFGVARSLGSDGLTRAGAVVGTPDYLSPEQIAGDPVDGRSDLYALGLVFYEMLAGRLPFRGASQAEVLAQRLTGRVRDVGEAGVRVPAWVRAVIRRCLERNPARRYQTARELLADLDRGAVRRATPRRALAVAAALIGLGLAVWGAHRYGLSRFPGGPPTAAEPAPEAAGHALAVLPLADQTADPALAWTGTGVAEMLASQLQESPDLRVLDAQRVFRVLRDLKLADARYDAEALSRLAQILEVDRLVTGSVRRAGETLRIDLRLVAVGPAGVAAARSLGAESPSAGGLFTVVRTLGDGLRRELGARSATPEPAGARASSLPAARAYREARDHLMVGDYLGAAPALERAVAADPRFAEGLERLSETYQSLGYQDKALSAAQRAAQLVGLSETRLGYRVRARLALLNGSPAEAERSYAELARRYPNDVEALLDLASAQGGRGAIERAVETLKQAAARDRNDPRVWYQLGKNTILMGDAARAANDYLLRALALQRQLGNEQGQADVENALGIAYHEMGQYAQALETYTQAAAARRRLGDRRGLAASLKNRARTYAAMGRLSEAEPDLAEARRIYGAIGDPAGQADVMDEFGVLYEERGDFARALAAYQEALRIRRGLGDERQLAQSHDNVGYIFFLQGEYENALAYWQQALERRRGIGDKGGTVLSLQNMGFIEIAQGRWAEAMKTFLEALRLGREIDFKSGIAVSHGNIGLLSEYDGRYGAALQSFDDALVLFRRLDHAQGLAEFTLKEAGALLELGALDQAKTRLDAGEAWVRKTGNHEQASDRLALLGEWHLRRGETAAARQALDQAVAEARASKGRAALVRARLARAEADLVLGDPATAARALGGVLQDAEALGEVMIRIRAAEALARAELARGRLPDAESAARRALKLADRCGWSGGRYRLHALLARILDRAGQAQAASAEYAQGARALSRVREGLTGDLRRAFDALPTVIEIDARAAAAPARAGRP